MRIKDDDEAVDLNQLPEDYVHQKKTSFTQMYNDSFNPTNGGYSKSEIDELKRK